MNLILITKDINTQEVLAEKQYKAINQIAKDLNTSYCSCYHNYLFNIGEITKPPKKRSQVLFNKQYKIVDAASVRK
jgi:hypothetical protein